MAYVTGTANSVADLLAGIQNACTANGWTLSGNVLHKGTCYAELMSISGALRLRCGRGIDGSNNLTDISNAPIAQLGVAVIQNGNVIPNVPFAYPCTYFIHVLQAPDEVYAVVNFAVSWYQSLAFGQSQHPGLTGSGIWYSGCNFTSGLPFGMNDVGVGTDNRNWQTFGLFAGRDTALPHGIDHSLDATNWQVMGAWRDTAATFLRQPNKFNSESVLLPIRVYAARPSAFWSVVHECAHARYVNIANLADQQIITLGTDRWRIYPWGARGMPYSRTSSFGAWSYGTNTGVMGHAIRYDGP